MSNPAATTAFNCQLHIGGFCAVLAVLLLLPAVTHAASADPSLRRSDKVDVRRLGKVSEDERSVLRMEWRAGLAGVEEALSVQAMFDNLRRVEADISEVSLLIRDMPVQKPAAAAAPVMAEANDASEFDWRLPVANIAALTLVAMWWFRRRKPATPTKPDFVSASAKLPPRATPREALSPALAPLDSAPEIPSVATQLPVAVTPVQAGHASLNEPVTADEAPDEAADVAPEPEPLATLEMIQPPSDPSPETKPAEDFSPDQTMIFDFSLEEADPEVVARENAKLGAAAPVSAPKPAPTHHETNVEPTLQLAEIMLSMGLEQGAAQALTEYIEANPRHAVYHWLKLLGIYRSRGLQKEFAETAEKLRAHFNIQAEEWAKTDTSEGPALEKFSRVSEHVQKIWSQTEECTKYLRHLLEDNRDGARAGFPQAVAEEILLLVEILKEGQA